MSPVLLSLIPASVLVALAAVLYRTERDMLAPGAAFVSIWSAAVLGPLLLAPDYYVSPAAVWCVVLLNVAWALGTVSGRAFVNSAGGGPAGTRSAPIPFAPIPFRRLVAIAGTATALALVGVVSYAGGLGIGVREFLSIEGISTIGRRVALARYYDDYTGTALSRALLMSGYLGVLLGGYAVGLRLERVYRGRAPVVLGALTLVPGLASGFLMTTKSSLLYGVLLWVVSLLATRRAVSRGRFRLRLRRVVPVVLGIGAVLTALFVFLNMIRYGWVESGRIWDALLRLRLYAFGHLGGLSVWYDTSGGSLLGGSLGAFTFAGVFDVLGVSARSMGVVSDLVRVGPGPFDWTNIYTALRGMVSDFGLIGGTVVIFAFGSFAGGSYTALARDSRAAGLVLYVSMFAFLLWSPITSIFNYNSFLASFVLFFGVLTVARRKPRLRFASGTTRRTATVPSFST